MEQAHARSLAALQQFILLANTTKNASPRFLADLIKRATEANGTFIFTELLQLPVIQSLRADDTPQEFRAHLTLLELFSWGTYEEYKKTPNLPDLNEAQIQKLKQLSLLTLASPFANNPSTDNALAYSSLSQSLHLATPADIESLVTSCIYAGLLTARLSPTSTPPAVHIHSVAPLRDLRPQSLPAILQILSTWSARCDNVVGNLEEHIASIKTAAQNRAALAQKRQDVIDAAVLSTNQGTDDADKKGGKKGVGQRGSKRDLDDEYEGSDGEMDVDEGFGEMGGVPGAPGTRGTKRNRGRG